MKRVYTEGLKEFNDKELFDSYRLISEYSGSGIFALSVILIGIYCGYRSGLKISNLSKRSKNRYNNYESKIKKKKK